MSWLVSIAVAVLAGIAGLLLAGFISDLCVSWYRIPSREGASGYFVLINAILGGLASVVIGFIAARVVAASAAGPGFGRELGAALGVIGSLALVSVTLARLLADVPPRLRGRDMNVELEFRFPTPAAGNPSPTNSADWTVRLSSISGQVQRTYRDGKVHTQQARREDGRWIVPAEVYLFTERGKRTVSLDQGTNSVAGFLVPLPRRPGAQFEEWSDWLPRQQPDGQPWPADRMSYRFRVHLIPPPPPPKSAEEVQTEMDAAKEEEFSSIPADAPVERWFGYIAYQNEFTQRAWDQITRRPNLAQELGRLALGDNAEVAGAAMRCMAEHPQPTAEFIPYLQAAGKDLAARIRRFNDTPVADDPSYLGAADASYRFHGWHQAVGTLRKCCGGDFIPELQEILELSRVRTDSIAMRSDICRVASYYLHEWAGIAPLPTDPKPR